ncbi:MAG TPA: helix-turn-helix transcriptional regulator [Streptosporangiaceae bacterium]|nr:helix-turn-helix transcriptional regulator [Streptosporangiaceae bacterium]
MAQKRETALELWGYEFARAREAAGFGSQVAFAAHDNVHVSASLIAHWETGRRLPRKEDLADCEKVLGTNGYLARLLDKWVSREVPTEWQDKWLSAEARATLIHNFELSVVPGLLQTESYARAVLRHNRRASIDVEEGVRARLARQAILGDGDPPTCLFVIDEYALRRNVGGPEVMVEQLTHLRDLAEHPDIVVQIVPSGVDYYAGCPFMLARFDGTEIANLDSALRGQIVEGHDEVAQITRVWEDIRRAALSPKESLELIEKVIAEWTS